MDCTVSNNFPSLSSISRFPQKLYLSLNQTLAVYPLAPGLWLWLGAGGNLFLSFRSSSSLPLPPLPHPSHHPPLAILVFFHHLTPTTHSRPLLTSSPLHRFSPTILGVDFHGSMPYTLTRAMSFQYFFDLVLVFLVWGLDLCCRWVGSPFVNSSMVLVDAHTCALISGVSACDAQFDLATWLVRLDAAWLVCLGLGCSVVCCCYSYGFSMSGNGHPTVRKFVGSLGLSASPPIVMSCTADPFSVLSSYVPLAFCAPWWRCCFG